MPENSISSVLSDENLMKSMKEFMLTVQKHGIKSVIEAIHFLDTTRIEKESHVSKVIDCVCDVVSEKKNKSKEVFKKELYTKKRGDYGMCRNLCVIFIHKYVNLTYEDLSNRFMRSKKRKDFALLVIQEFKQMNKDGNVFEKEFLALYDEIDNRLNK